MSQKAILTCAITGVLTDPKMHHVPVTAEEMASAALEAWNAGATVVHCHFRDQGEGKGALPTWEPEVVAQICDAIRTKVPGILINMSTGVLGKDISGPLACMKRVRPEIAALNMGSLNYLKAKEDGTWAWPPMLFDNKVEKIQGYLEVMNELNILPECECFDTGIVRSINMFEKVGLLKKPLNVSLVMGVSSGMPAKAAWLPLLLEELPKHAQWQAIAIGRTEVWNVHRKTAELGGHLRTGLEDTFYLPSGDKTFSNGRLIEELAKMVKQAGRDVASIEDTRKIYQLK